MSRRRALSWSCRRFCSVGEIISWIWTCGASVGTAGGSVGAGTTGVGTGGVGVVARRGPAGGRDPFCGSWGGPVLRAAGSRGCAGGRCTWVCGVESGSLEAGGGSGGLVLAMTGVGGVTVFFDPVTQDERPSTVP